MALSVGSQPVSNLKIGTQDVQRLYKGSTLLWERSTAPATVFGLASFIPNNANSLSLELGWAFRTPASGITVNSLRIYDSAAASREISLWDEGGQKLRSVTVQSAVGEWVVGSVAPVTLAGNTVYIVSRNGVNAAPYSRIDQPTNAVFNTVTFLHGRYGSNGQFPSTPDPILYGIADIGFTVPT